MISIGVLCMQALCTYHLYNYTKVVTILTFFFPLQVVSWLVVLGFNSSLIQYFSIPERKREKEKEKK